MPTMNAQEFLDRADALAAGATEGPWRVGVEGSEGSRVNRDSGDKRADSRALLICNGLVQPEDGRNAAFIAASRTLVPAMSTALRAVLDRCLSIEADARAGQKYAGEVNNGALLMAESSRETTAREIRSTVQRSLDGAS